MTVPIVIPLEMFEILVLVCHLFTFPHMLHGPCLVDASLYYYRGTNYNALGNLANLHKYEIKRFIQKVHPFSVYSVFMTCLG